jgi:hypothetical protein
MRYRPPQWPTIIALLVGGWGLGTIFRAWPVEWGSRATWANCDWSAIAASAFLFVLSYFLATRRDWARQILLVVVLIFGLIPVIVHVGEAFGPLTLSDLPADHADMVRLRWRLSDVSSFFSSLSLLVFAVLFLCHPQIISSFRDRPPSSKEV